MTPGRSLAVDTAIMPLGVPVFLDTTWPGSGAPLQRLMVAQDTGSAIKGAVRGDFFWGSGEAALAHAGGMKQQGTATIFSCPAAWRNVFWRAARILGALFRRAS